MRTLIQIFLIDAGYRMIRGYDCYRESLHSSTRDDGPALSLRVQGRIVSQPV